MSRELVFVPPPPSDPASPIIDEIRIERDSVCRGEEDLVSVKAHSPSGDDACLHYFIGIESGRQVPVRFLEPYTKTGSWPTVGVFDCNNTATFVTLPAVTVRDCEIVELDVEGGVLPNTVMEFGFQARPRHASGFAPVRFDWDFGDGAHTSGSSTATHDFWHSAGAGAYTELLITAVASDAQGRQIRGRMALELRNSSYEARSAGRIQVLTQPVGAATTDADGAVRWDYLLWHYERAPVTLDSAMALRLHRSGAVDQSPVDLATLATIPAIPPGERVQATFEHDFSNDGDVYAINYELTGHGETLPATAYVTVFAR